MARRYLSISRMLLGHANASDINITHFVRGRAEIDTEREKIYDVLRKRAILRKESINRLPETRRTV